MNYVLVSELLLCTFAVCIIGTYYDQSNGLGQVACQFYYFSVTYFGSNHL